MSGQAGKKEANKCTYSRMALDNNGLVVDNNFFYLSYFIVVLFLLLDLSVHNICTKKQ